LLPFVFLGWCRAHLLGDIHNKTQLQRYMVAYGADIEPLGEDITHIVIPVDRSWNDELETLYTSHNAFIVSALWAWDCINCKTRLPESAYLLRPT
jgi:hypothetical protein